MVAPLRASTRTFRSTRSRTARPPTAPPAVWTCSWATSVATVIKSKRAMAASPATAPTGQLAYTGTRNLPEVNVFNYNVSPNAPNCPNAGESSCLIETNQSSGQKIDAQVDVYGLVQEVDDTIGHAWGMTYDNNAELDLASVTNQGTGGQTGYTYTTTATSPYNHNMQTLVNPLGGTESIHYYAYGMVQWVASPLGGTTNYNYSATDCATVAGCLGESQTTMVSYPDHEVDGDYYLFGTLEQTAFGPATTFNGPADELWIFSPSYPSNQDGWMDEGVTLPGGSTATIITDAVGNVVTYTDPKGNVTNSMYNDTGGNDLDEELCWTAMPGVSVPSNASCSNPPAGSTHYTYDAYGDQLSKTDPLGNTTYSGYYTDGDLCWTAQPTVGNGSACGNIGTSPSGAPAGSTAYTYSNGNVATKTVAYGTTFAQETQTSYDGESQINYTIPPDGISAGGFGSNAYETAYTYHAYGELLSSTAPLGRVTTYTYNPAGGVLTETDPGGVTTNTYDVDGRTCWTLRATAASAAACTETAPYPTGSTGYQYLADTSAPTSVTGSERSRGSSTPTTTTGSRRRPPSPLIRCQWQSPSMSSTPSAISA